MLAQFDGAERVVRGAVAIRDAAGSLDLEIRAGVHSGKVQVTADLVDGSDLRFEDAGSFELKGLHGSRQLYRLV